MFKKPSESLRDNYPEISTFAKKTKEPIYITKDGEVDMVLMSMDAYEKREQILELRAKVLQAEQEKINGEETLSVSRARKMLSEHEDET